MSGSNDIGENRTFVLGMSIVAGTIMVIAFNAKGCYSSDNASRNELEKIRVEQRRVCVENGGQWVDPNCYRISTGPR